MHKNARLTLGRESHAWSRTERGTLVLSDEKKLNIRGLDHFAYCRHDLRRRERIYSKLQAGSGVMVLGTFSKHGVSQLDSLEGSQNALKYIGKLENYLLRLACSIFNAYCIVEQNIGSIHKAKVRREWFATNVIDVGEWPARSPDLNPVDNI